MTREDLLNSRGKYSEAETMYVCKIDSYVGAKGWRVRRNVAVHVTRLRVAFRSGNVMQVYSEA